MTIEKKTLREALAMYRAWNDDKLICQALEDRCKTPAEKWSAYLDLYSFGISIQPQASQLAQEQTMREWEAYYSRIRQFEARRRQYARTD